MNVGTDFLCPACGRPVSPSADRTAVYAEIEQAVGAPHGSREYAPDEAWFHVGCWPNPFYRRYPRPDGTPDQTLEDASEPRTLWFPFSWLVLVGAAYLVYIALIILLIGYSEDVHSDTPAIVQFVIAVAGIVPAFAMMVSGFLDRARPGAWFVATLGVYGAWALYIRLVMGAW